MNTNKIHKRAHAEEGCQESNNLTNWAKSKAVHVKMGKKYFYAWKRVVGNHDNSASWNTAAHEMRKRAAAFQT